MTGGLGVGLAFPIRVGEDGQVALSADEVNVRESIRVLLSTAPGERLMRPGFGAGLDALLFAPNTPATHGLMAERITTALRRWEPRVRVRDVQVDAAPDDPRRAVAMITYEHVATGRPGVASVDLATGG